MSVRGEDGVEHQVGQHVEGDGHVFGERLDVEADGFLAGEGVEVAADGVHFAGDVLGGAGARALEEHVLDKVGDAVGFGGFAAGAGLDPDAHGHGAQVFHALGENDQAVRQYSAAKISFGCSSSFGLLRFVGDRGSGLARSSLCRLRSNAKD